MYGWRHPTVRCLEKLLLRSAFSALQDNLFRLGSCLMLQFLPRDPPVVSTSPSRASFKPGESAPVSGIYRVSHGESHRQPHDLLLKKGEVFPPCRHCGDQARFRLRLGGGEEHKAHH